MSIERKPVVSSNVVSVGYDAASGTLQVEYKGGNVYEYHNVPVKIHEQMMSARSIGSYIASTIKGQFSFRLLPPEKPETGKP